MSRFSAWKISQFSARALRFGPRKTLAVRLQQCERLAARGKGLSSPKRRFCWGDPLRGALCTSVISWHSCAKTTQYLWLKKAYLMMIPFDWDFLEVARPSIAFSSSFRSWTRDWLRVVEWRRSPENLEDSSLNTASYGCFIVSAMTKRTFQKGLHRKAVTVCFISSWKAGKQKNRPVSRCWQSGLNHLSRTVSADECNLAVWRAAQEIRCCTRDVPTSGVATLATLIPASKYRCGFDPASTYI